MICLVIIRGSILVEISNQDATASTRIANKF